MRRTRGKVTNTTYILTIILSVVIGAVIGVIFCGDLRPFLINPFNNTQGEFDFSILWTAFAGLGTIFLGLVAFLQNRNMHKQNVALQNKQLINENSLKLYNNKQGLLVLNGTECDSSVEEKLGGISSLIHKRIRNIDEIRYNTRKWFIVTLKCDNFKPPVQLRVAQVNIYVRDQRLSKLRDMGNTYPKYTKHSFTNRDTSFYCVIDSIDNHEITFGFELICNSKKFQFNIDDEKFFTIKGLIEVKSNDLVECEYGFRTVYFFDNKGKKNKTSVNYLGGMVLDIQSEFDIPTRRKHPRKKKRKRWFHFWLYYRIRRKSKWFRIRRRRTTRFRI